MVRRLLDSFFDLPNSIFFSEFMVQIILAFSLNEIDTWMQLTTRLAKSRQSAIPHVPTG